MSAISNSIIGIVVGLVLALIIVLILQNTIFKNNNMKILYVIIFILFAICGGVIQSKFFTASADAIPTPQEQINTITTTINDNWKNTNGGFTFEQIQTAQNDSNCPLYDDQIIDLTCYDFGSYEVFSFENDGVYQNAVFFKSENGLILDGIINIHPKMTGLAWFLAYDLNSFHWIDERNTMPEYKKTYVAIDWDIIGGLYDNLLSVSRQSTDCLQYNYAVRTNKNEAINYVLKNIANITAENITSHFIKFEDTELIGSGEDGYVKINSFYNYLYQEIKGQPYNTSKLIDASSCLCVPIPENIQQNYPIEPALKAEYDNADYYGVYRTSIGVNLKFVKGNEMVNATLKNDEYVSTLNKDENYKNQVQVETISPSQNLSQLNINFFDEQNSDLTNLNLLTKPVKITFTCQELAQTKTVLIDSLDKLNAGTSVLLAQNATWNYYIESPGLIFENFRGCFTIKSTENNISFSYYFLDNFTVASVGLNPIGTIDKSVIDLAQNPVKIILSNDSHTYQFTFDNNSFLDTYQSSLVEMGTYNYTILSDQLLFASVTGSLTITTTDKIMLFNYGLAPEEALSFAIDITESGTTNNRFSLYSDASNVTLIRNTLSSNKVYLVTCVIYDNDGKLLETFEHEHQVTGTCTDYWTASNLVDSETYILQLRFTDKYDPTITYLSDISTFTFKANTNFKVTYHVTEN